MLALSPRTQSSANCPRSDLSMKGALPPAGMQLGAQKVQMNFAPSGRFKGQSSEPVSPALL